MSRPALSSTSFLTPDLAMKYCTAPIISMMIAAVIISVKEYRLTVVIMVDKNYF
jgi:hypothetical protein